LDLQLGKHVISILDSWRTRTAISRSSWDLPTIDGEGLPRDERRCGDQARSDGIHADALSGIIERGCLCETDHAMLGRDVRRRVPAGGQVGHRRTQFIG